jgi:uncharacterized protein (DUF2141 family)
MKLLKVIALEAIATILCGQGLSYAGEIRVVVTGLRNVEGHVRIALFENAEGFPEGKKSLARVAVPIAPNEVSASFNEIPAGTYAVSLFHDENNNEVLEKNFLGVPKEGIGFSNNPRALLRAPGFDEAKFSFSGSEFTVTIRIQY